MKSKSIFSSKTFWVNLVSAVGMGAVEYTGTQLPVDNGTVAAALAIANIFLRKLADRPVHVVTAPVPDPLHYR